MVSCMACICVLAYLGLTVILYDLEYDLCCLYDYYYITFPLLITLPACSGTSLPSLSDYCISINT